MGGVKKEGFKRFYPDTEMLTKHFLLSSVNNPKVFRHYTSCNAMNPPVYEEYIKILRYAMENGGQIPDDSNIKHLLDSSSSNSAMFTIKNYNQEGGVSKKVHEQADTFTVKGPMGKGLMPQQSGLHVAFAAGTGALCFVDLVAWIIRQVLGMSETGDKMINSTSDQPFATENTDNEYDDNIE